MSDTLVETPGSDLKETSGESISIETSQPSLLKKGGLFGNSVALSPKIGDGPSSPADEENENGDTSTTSKNGDESAANGESHDHSSSNGDCTEDPIEEMETDETEKEEELKEPEDVSKEDEMVDPEEETLNEQKDAEIPAAVEESEDTEMVDEIEEEEEEKGEPAKEDEKEEVEEEKEEEEKKEDETKEEEEKMEEEKKDEEEVEEECVKKVISMDTDKTEEAAESEEKTEEVAEEAAEEEKKEEEEKEEEEKTEAVATPKRGRGRPRLSSTPATAKKAEEGEESGSVKRTPRGAAKKATEALATPTPTRGRGRRSLKSDSQPTEEEEKVEEGEKEEAEEEVKTPAVGRGRRSAKSTPATATRGTPRGRKAVEKEEEEKEEEGEGEEKEEEEKEEEGEGEEKEEEEKEEGEGEEKEEEKEEVEEEEKKTPGRRGRKPASAAATPAAVKASPATSPRTSPRKAAKEKEEEESNASSPSRKSARGSPTKATPKGRGRNASVKSEETNEEEEEEKEEEEAPKKGRGRGRKSVAKTPKKEGDDPFDLDTELDKHPEPLRNITVEKGSFGEMKYTRSPAASKSKYAAFEKSASDKVANLPNTPAAVGAPKTIASAQSNRKSLGGSPVKKTATPRRKKVKEEEEGEEEEEEMDLDEEAVEKTPAVKKDGRGRPPGSVGRKRKADESPAAATSSKKAAKTVDIPELDAEKQWAADHPEDDSAPLLPGARVFALFQKVFYPALVGDRDGLGRYMVEFVEDKIVRPIPPAGVVPLSAVTIDKECLYQGDEDIIECRVVRSANAANAKEWQEGIFKIEEIENSDNVHDVEWCKLQLDMATEEWKKYVHEMSKKATQVGTGNIASMQDRRDRRSRVHNDTAVAVAALDTPEPKGRRSVVKKTPATAKATPKADGTTPGRRGRKPKAAVAAAEAEGEEESAAPAAAPEENVEEREVEQEEEKMEVEQTTEPAPEDDNRIFLNKTFILTSANRAANEVFFKKNEMKRQIIERGGCVVDDINMVPLDAEAYLISDTHYRTHKYLAAMSRGMPCVSHEWMRVCVTSERFVPYDSYKLAGGQGLLNGELYPLPDVRGKLLKDRNIMIYSNQDAMNRKGTMSFQQIWTPIVELLGANLISDECLQRIPSDLSTLSFPAECEILLTDSSCSAAVVAHLQAMGKAVVSSEWLIQSIIMGECPAFDAHQRFRYDSGNEPAKRAEPEREGSQ